MDRQTTLIASAVLLSGSLVTLSIHARQVAESEVHITAFIALLLVVLGHAVLSRPTPGVTLGLLTFLFVVFALPTMTTGQLHGYDVWYYVQTTKVILASGWDPAGQAVNVNSYLYPGMQMFTALLVRVTGLLLERAAEYVPIFLKGISIVSIYVIVRLFTRSRYAVVAPLLVVGFYNFTAWLPFHHITYGYAVKLLVLFVFLKVLVNSFSERPVKRPLVVVYVVLFLALLVSHQLSTFHVGLLVGTAILVVGGTNVRPRLDDAPLTQRAINRMTVLLLSMGVLFAYYYTDVGIAYVIGLLSIQLGSVGPASPDPLLVEKLSLIHSPGFVEKLVTSKFILSVEVLAGAVGLTVILHLRRFREWEPVDKLPLLVITSWLVVLGGMAIFHALSPIVVGGLRRQFLLAVPLGAILVGLVYERTEGRPRRVLRVVVPLCIALFLVLNMQLYPGYFVGDGTAADEERYELVMTDERRAAYDWFSRGSQVYGSTQARLYLHGTESGIHVSENYYPYTGLPRFLRDGSFLLVRPEFKTYLLMRSNPYQYRIPGHLYDSYGSNTVLDKVYSNNVTIYRTSHND